MDFKLKSLEKVKTEFLGVESNSGKYLPIQILTGPVLDNGPMWNCPRRLIWVLSNPEAPGRKDLRNTDTKKKKKKDVEKDEKNNTACFLIRNKLAHTHEKVLNACKSQICLYLFWDFWIYLEKSR